MNEQTRTIDLAIDDARLTRLHEHAREEGVTVNEIILRAIDDRLVLGTPRNKQRDLLHFLLNEPRIDIGSPEELRRLIEESHLSREYWDDADTSGARPDV